MTQKPAENEPAALGHNQAVAIHRALMRARQDAVERVWMVHGTAAHLEWTTETGPGFGEERWTLMVYGRATCRVRLSWTGYVGRIEGEWLELGYQ